MIATSSRVSKIMFLLYGIAFVSLFLYSFTQIDLGLALTRFPALYKIQQAFQYVGYFNRPLSTYLYGGIVLSFFVLYCLTLYFIQKKKVDEKTIFRIILLGSGILLFSYTAFSHDIFNYIFDAKILTKYGQNPYEHKALDFPGDPMLGFMHWTHRTYPYGPAWLLLTVPLSYLGMQIFTATFFLFKLLMTASFVGTVWYIKKISQKVFPKYTALSVALFGLNPLVLFESLVSAHNDIVMLFFAVAALYYLLEKKYLLAFGLLLFSIAIKYATLFLLPVFIFIWYRQRQKKEISWQFVSLSMVILMTGAVLAATNRTNFQPWYLLYVLPFAAFAGYKSYVFIPLFFFSILGLLTYAPYLYYGNWDAEVQTLLTLFTHWTYIVTFVAILIFTLFKRRVLTMIR